MIRGIFDEDVIIPDCEQSDIKTPWENTATAFNHRIIYEANAVKKCHEDEIRLTAENPYVHEQIETTELCQQLSQYKHDITVDSKRRLQLHNNSHELRELRKEILLAHAINQLSAQKESEMLKQQSLAAERQKIKREAERLRLRHIELTRQEDQQQHLKKVKLRNALIKQMEEKKLMLRRENEEKKRDNDTLLRMQQQYDAEQLKEQLATKMRNDKFQKELAEVLANRIKGHGVQEPEAVVDSHYFDNKRQIQEDAIQRRRLATQKREVISNMLGERLHKRTAESTRNIIVITDLLCEERVAKIDEHEEELLAKQAMDRKQMCIELDRYNRDKLKKLEETRALLAEQREQIHQYYRDKELQHQQNRAKDRQKKIEYRKEMLNFIECKRRHKATDDAIDLEHTKHNTEMVIKNDELIAKERLRMLRAEPPNVLEHIPYRVVSYAERLQL